MHNTSSSQPALVPDRFLPEHHTGRGTLQDKTFAHQDDLPPLPLPTLDATLRKYLRSVRPFVTDAEFATTSRHVDSMLESNSDGRTLQAALLAHAERERAEMESSPGRGNGNWMQRWWIQYAYLMWPDAFVPQEASYYKEMPVPTTQVERAATLIEGCLQYLRLIETAQLEPSITRGGTPLCMWQYAHMVCETRVPGESGDARVEAGATSHVAVNAGGGEWYALTVFDEERRFRPTDELEAELEWIKQDAAARVAAHGPSPAIGMLTTGDRVAWGKARRRLLEHDGNGRCNAHALRMIESAILVIVLDPASPPDVRSPGGMEAGFKMITTEKDAARRWHDKSLSLIAFANGKAGGTIEHSAVDGTCVASLTLFHMFYAHRSRVKGERMVRRPSAHHVASRPLGRAQRLCWNVPHDVIERIALQRRIHCERADDCDVAQLKDTSMRGRGYLAMQAAGFRASDSFVQMALQLCVYRCLERIVPTYESVSVLRFFHGRTETCRSASSEALAFASAFDDDAIADEVKLRLLEEAIAAHRTYISDAVKGHGVDRHLLGLRIVAGQLDLDLPLFSDPAFARSGSLGGWTLSTSSAPIVTSEATGFNFADRAGWGVCYQIYNDFTTMTITSSASAATELRNGYTSAGFGDIMISAMDDMLALGAAREKQRRSSSL